MKKTLAANSQSTMVWNDRWTPETSSGRRRLNGAGSNKSADLYYAKCRHQSSDRRRNFASAEPSDGGDSKSVRERQAFCIDGPNVSDICHFRPPFMSVAAPAVLSEGRPTDGWPRDTLTATK